MEFPQLSQVSVRPRVKGVNRREVHAHADAYLERLSKMAETNVPKEIKVTEGPFIKYLKLLAEGLETMFSVGRVKI